MKVTVVACIDGQRVDLAQLALVGASAVEDHAQARAPDGRRRSPGRELHPLHAAGEDSSAILQHFDGQQLARAPAPPAGSAGILANIVFDDTHTDLALDGLQRMIGEVRRRIVARVDAVMTCERAHAAHQRLDHGQVALAPGDRLGEHHRHDHARSQRRHQIGAGLHDRAVQRVVEALRDGVAHADRIGKFRIHHGAGRIDRLDVAIDAVVERHRFVMAQDKSGQAYAQPRMAIAKRRQVERGVDLRVGAGRVDFDDAVVHRQLDPESAAGSASRDHRP